MWSSHPCKCFVTLFYVYLFSQALASYTTSTTQECDNHIVNCLLLSLSHVALFGLNIHVLTGFFGHVVYVNFKINFIISHTYNKIIFFGNAGYGNSVDVWFLSLINFSLIASILLLVVAFIIFNLLSSSWPSPCLFPSSL